MYASSWYLPATHSPYFPVLPEERKEWRNVLFREGLCVHHQAAHRDRKLQIIHKAEVRAISYSGQALERKRRGAREEGVTHWYITVSMYLLLPNMLSVVACMEQRGKLSPIRLAFAFTICFPCINGDTMLEALKMKTLLQACYSFLSYSMYLSGIIPL